MPVPGPAESRDPCARCNPVVIRLEGQAEPVVENRQIAIPITGDRLRHDCLNFLRHYANIGVVAAVVAEAIEAEAIVEVAEQDDVVLEPEIGPPTPAAAACAAGAPSTAGAVDSLGTALHADIAP